MTSPATGDRSKYTPTARGQAIARICIAGGCQAYVRNTVQLKDRQHADKPTSRFSIDGTPHSGTLIVGDRLAPEVVTKMSEFYAVPSRSDIPSKISLYLKSTWKCRNIKMMLRQQLKVSWCIKCPKRSLSASCVFKSRFPLPNGMRAIVKPQQRR